MHIDHAVRVAGGDESILQHQALVVMGTVVNEGLLVAEGPGNAPDFIASRHVIKTRFYLRKKNNRFSVEISENSSQ